MLKEKGFSESLENLIHSSLTQSTKSGNTATNKMNKIKFLQHLNKVSIEESLCPSDLATLATIAPLQNEEGATIEGLESALSIGYMKQKIYRLEKAGLVIGELVPQTAGRPLKFCKLTNKGLSIVTKLLQGQP